MGDPQYTKTKARTSARQTILHFLIQCKLLKTQHLRRPKFIENDSGGDMVKKYNMSLCKEST